MKPISAVTALLSGLLLTLSPISAHAGLKNGRFDINASGGGSDRWGGDGGNAGNVTLSLSYADSAKTQVKISGRVNRGGSTKNSDETFNARDLKLIAIHADGGNGANGYSGSSGSDGRNGNDGRDGSNGSDGCPGGNGYRGDDGDNGSDGSDGSHGGDGGNGGRGGKILVSVSPEQTELLLLVKTSSSGGVAGEGGSGGSGGRGGRGGSGGRGGQGGRGTCVDSEGRPVGGNDGSNGWNGSDGRSGSDGRNGSSGSDGSTGSAGSHAFEVGSQKYSNPFRLAMSQLKFVDDNEDGILQPGEKLHLTSLTVNNRGGMSSPANQDIKLTLFNNAILTVKQTKDLVISDTIAAGSSKTMNFAKGEVVLEAVAKTSAIGEQANVSLRIGINAIAIDDALESGFALHWPVAIVASEESGAGYFGTSKALKFTVKNVGSKGIGPDGAQPVDIRFVWTSKEVPGSDVTITLKDGRSFKLKDAVVISNLAIPPKATLGLTVTTLVKNSKSLLTATGALRIELHLKSMSSGADDKVDVATSKLNLAFDLRPQTISRSVDLRNQGVVCRYPNTIFKNQTLTWLTVKKAKGADAVKIQFATAGLFSNDPSPVYTVSAYDFASYSRAFAGTPSAGTVMQFLNANIVGQTRRGQAQWIIDRCGR